MITATTEKRNADLSFAIEHFERELASVPIDIVRAMYRTFTRYPEQYSYKQNTSHVDAIGTLIQQFYNQYAGVSSLTTAELTHALLNVTAKIISHPIIMNGCGEDAYIKDIVQREIYNISLNNRAVMCAFIEELRENGYLSQLPNPNIQSVQVLEKVSREVGKSLPYSKLESIELLALVAHTFYSLLSTNGTPAPAVEQDVEDIPVSGYHDVPEPDEQQLLKVRLKQVLRNLNPAACYQVFKFANKAVGLNISILMCLASQQKSVSEYLFPNEDVTLMRAALDDVLESVVGDKPTLPIGNWFQLFNVVNSMRSDFYLVDSIDQTPMDTSFTDEIIESAPARQLAAGFKTGFESHLSREATVVIPPTALLENIARIKEDAVKQAVKELNEILGNPQRVNQIAKYNLVRGLVTLEIPLKSSLDGIAVEVMNIAEKSGWTAVLNVDKGLILEARIG